MGPYAKRIVKNVVGRFLVRTGLWGRLLRMWARRSEAIILTYHRVIEKWDRTLDYSQPGMVVTTETFERQIHFLQDQFDIVPLRCSIGEHDTHRSYVRPRCIITFDDGWRDNYEIAFPILRKHRVPATLFLSTEFIDTERIFWHTELISLLLHGELSEVIRHQSVFESYPACVRHRLIELARMKRSPSAHDVDPLIEAVKECNDDISERLIRDLNDVVKCGRPLFSGRRFFLDWDQVREMAGAGLEIGSHGCSHRILTRLKTEEAKEEMIRSKAEIEGRIGLEAQHFAFPNEAANRDLLALAEVAGYRTACLGGSEWVEGRFGALPLRRQGMAEEASGGGDGSFQEGRLLSWLFRAPRVRLA